MTTQYLEEADELADTIAVVDHGKIIAKGIAIELKSNVGGERIEVVVDKASRLWLQQKSWLGFAAEPYIESNRSG